MIESEPNNSSNRSDAIETPVDASCASSPPKVTFTISSSPPPEGFDEDQGLKSQILCKLKFLLHCKPLNHW